MSRVGNQPIEIPAGVTVMVDNNGITASGPKGTLKQSPMKGVKVATNLDKILVNPINDEAPNRAKQGLMRQLISNMVEGVSKGFERKLEVNGVGYRVSAQGQELKFNLGFSHDVIYKVPEGVNVSVDQNIITVNGNDKQQVGQVAAEIRALKKPEPYKGKGIKYVEEQIIRKSGKSGKEATA